MTEPRFQNSHDVLTFAIEREEEAASFYREQAEKMENPAMRQVFLDFAAEEEAHKTRLMAVRSGERPIHTSKEKVANLRIADYLEKSPPVGPYMTYAEMLTVAMLREKQAFRLYTNLAAIAEDADAKAFFEALATEEARHKLRFELEYDREMFGEN